VSTKAEEKVIEIETFESEYSGWKLSAWKWYETWYVTAELFDRVALSHGICHGQSPSREIAEAMAKKRIDTNKNIKWTFYVRHAGGHLEVLRKETT
jgi:hypothetical protein